MRKILIIAIFCYSGFLAAQGYHVGSLYTAPDGSQGIVYYLYPDGSGGLVVALNDVSESCAWGEPFDVTGLVNQPTSPFPDLMSDTAGYANTQAIRDYYTVGECAAKLVDFDHGWVLPSPAQMSILYAQLPFVSDSIVAAGGTDMAAEPYWCSAEVSNENAWRVDFSLGVISGTLKFASCHVRAVRSFSYVTEPPTNLSYLWSTGATTPTITVSPEMTTTYTVTITSQGGCADTVSKTIVVNGTAPQTFYSSVCQGDVYIDNGFNVTAEETSITGLLIRTRTEVVDGCDVVYKLELTINPSSEATITASVDTICEEEEVTLQAVASIHNTSIAIGDILCTDGTTVKPAEYNNSGKVAMGVVYYVDNTGRHGWAVNLHDESSGIPWSPRELWADIPTLVNYRSSRAAIKDLDGYNNTMKIRAAGDSNAYPAAYSVDFANGWYLPAAGQLNLLYAELMTINASLQIVGGTQFSMYSSLTYWSSTEYTIHYAYYLASGELISGYDNKGVNFSVRSTRDF